MLISRGQLVLGRDAVTLRDQLRQLAGSSFTIDTVQRVTNLPADLAAELIEELITEGLAEVAPDTAALGVCHGSGPL